MQHSSAEAKTNERVKSGRTTRGGTRFAVSIPVEVRLAGGRLRCFIRNLSIGGAFIDAPLVIARDTRLLLRVELPHDGHVLEVGGLVRWSEPGGFGLRFNRLRAFEVWALGDFLESLKTP